MSTPETPKGVVLNAAHLFAGRRSAEFSDMVMQAESEMLNNGEQRMPLRQSVFFRNLSYMAQVICGESYAGEFSYAVGTVPTSDRHVLRVQTGIGKWYLFLDDQLMIDHALDPLVVEWKLDSDPGFPVHAKDLRFTEVEDAQEDADHE